RIHPGVDDAISPGPRLVLADRRSGAHAGHVVPSDRAAGTAPRIDRTGGQDSDEHLVAQALLRSPRRRGVAPHRALPGHRQIRGKTTIVDRSEGQEALGAPGTSILSRPSV